MIGCNGSVNHQKQTLERLKRAAQEGYLPDRVCRDIQLAAELAQIGLEWRTDSSLENWFPLSAQELHELRQKADPVEQARNRVMACGYCGGEFYTYPEGESQPTDHEAALRAFAAHDRACVANPLANENRQLRRILVDVLKALGNGSGCVPEARVEFMQHIPNEVAAVIAEAREGRRGD